ncbi:TRAP transporter small permease [Azoarcus indigens]|uniref:TRAP transporter small permease protein n=1 Tax=Azoarcus indigens TaxID=29545 RepID=A0A4V3BLW2_9RHOO|nr:TRAP transporter small permease [Azoarcus indigens]TDN48182.1 TRAP-type C4-dicarboxylate transport system permease small subunit [Azoarcus indigens]
MEKLSRGLITLLNAAAGLLFAAAIAINFVNVVGRYVFHAPLFWAEEVTTLLVIWSVCLMSYRLTANGEHLVTDILRPFLPASLQRALLLAVTAFGVAATGFVAYYAYVVVALVARLQQLTTVAELPKEVANGSILACFALALAGSLVRLLQMADTRRPLPGAEPAEVDDAILATEGAK